MIIWQLLLIAVVIVGAILFIVWVVLRRNFHKTTVNEYISTDKVALRIAVPRNNEKSPLAAEQLFTSLHGMGLSKAKSPDQFSLEIVAGSYGIHFLVIIRAQYQTFFENQIYAQYPEAQITKIGDYTPTLLTQGSHIKVAELVLAKEHYLPIRTFVNFDVDPLAGITGAVSNLPKGQEVAIQIISRPLADSWQQKGKNYVAELRSKTDSAGNKVQLESGQSEQIGMVETKNSKVGFQSIIRIVAKTSDAVSTERLINETVAAFGQYRTADFNRLSAPKKLKGFAKFTQDMRDLMRSLLLGRRQSERLSPLQRYTDRFLDEFSGSIVNAEELASLYHLPSKSVETPSISWARSKKLEYPLDIPQADCRIIGETDYRGQHIKFGIRPLDRLRHMYVIGKTGVGKSTFMESMVLADIYDGQGVGVIDPHGETINDILARIPPHRLEDVIVFDPGDTEYPVGLNLLQISEEEDKSMVADGIVSVFKKEFGDSWGPRLEYILTNAILTLLHCQNVSILVLPRLLSDDNYRAFLLKQVQDPILRKFWHEEYDVKDKRRQAEEISSILNKVGRFTTNPIIRNIVGQVKSSFNIKDLMDNRKIFLVNLAQGKIGEENMSLLGGMLVTRLYTNATRRISQPKDQRVPFYLYIDEFQNFSTSTFEKILSEARKFGLSLTIAHQFTDQIEPSILSAILGNVGSMMTFNIGPKDAGVFAKEFSPYVQEDDLVGLGLGEVILKMSIDIAQSKPFTARTLLPNFPDTNISDEIIKRSRQKHGVYRGKMEEKIYKWVEQRYNKYGNVIPPQSEVDQQVKAKQDNKPRQVNKPNLASKPKQVDNTKLDPITQSLGRREKQPVAKSEKRPESKSQKPNNHRRSGGGNKARKRQPGSANSAL